MTTVHLLILLSYIISGYSQVCEKNPQQGETQILDTHHWKQVNDSAKVLNVSTDKITQEKTRHRNWFDAGGVNGSFGVISRGIQFLAPTFIFSSDIISDERCKSDYDTYLKELSELKLWAVKMYDSSGKFSSGLLNGNINQFGDFDQCLSISNQFGDIKGKYCLIHLQINLNQQVHENVKEIFKLAHSHYTFRNEITDPGQRIPKFSSINWSLCIPSSCSHEEVENQLKHFIQTNSDGSHLDVQFKVDEKMCYMKKPFELSKSFAVVSTFLICIIALVLVSTVKDVIFDDPDANPSTWMDFLDCFSLKRNTKQLSNTDREPDDITSIHGIRMINSILLLLSHKSMAIFFFPFANRTTLVESFASQPWTVIVRIASLYTDSFIMISGTLTAYSFSKKLQKNGSIDVISEYLNRIIRIFPLFIFTVLFSTFILPELGSGPQWGTTVSHHANSCKNSWWMNFLFIHNYFGFENMCLTHTHHLGIDTQLFITSPFLVYILHKWQLLGAGVLIFIAAVSTGLRYCLTVEKSLSYFIYQGISSSQMLDTANYSYIIPSHRMTVYIIGIITGYILRNVKKYEMKNNTIRIGWMIALTLFYYVISKSMSMNYMGYVYNKTEAGIYSALCPIAWCLVLGWIMFTSHINSGSLIERVLSSKFFQIWTRISYAVYLIQFPMFFYKIGSERYSTGFTFSYLINAYEYFNVIAASVIITLFVDMPSNNIRKLIRQKFSIHAKKI